MKTFGKKLKIAASTMFAGAIFAGSWAVADSHNPYRMADNTWITINGTVEAVTPDRFVLDYGDASVIVEFDDGDRDADAYQLLAGDKVTVSGRIDDDFLETTKIEAASVYVENLGTTFFASAMDEETSERLMGIINVPAAISSTVVQGTVTSVDDSEFKIDAGASDIQVDVKDMAYDPLDDKGYQKIEVGDRVKVTGDVEGAFLEGYELVADSVVKLDQRDGERNAM
jgi:uncharacterized protein YdeI (BOF family)